MNTGPLTIQDELLHILGCVQAANGCLQGSTVANAGIMSDYHADACKHLLALDRSTRHFSS